MFATGGSLAPATRNNAAIHPGRRTREVKPPSRSGKEPSRAPRALRASVAVDAPGAKETRERRKERQPAALVEQGRPLHGLAEFSSPGKSGHRSAARNGRGRSNNRSAVSPETARQEQMFPPTFHFWND